MTKKVIGRFKKMVRNIFAPEVMVGGEYRKPVKLNRKQRRAMDSIKRKQANRK